jgi:hypothetical protein
MEKSFTKEQSDKLLKKLKKLNKESQDLIGTDFAQLNFNAKRKTNEASKGYIYFLTKTKRWAAIKPCNEKKIENSLFTFDDFECNDDFIFNIFQVKIIECCGSCTIKYYNRKKQVKRCFDRNNIKMPSKMHSWYIKPEFLFKTEQEIIDYIKKIYT